jgi:hypothetical protein
MLNLRSGSRTTQYDLHILPNRRRIHRHTANPNYSAFISHALCRSSCRRVVALATSATEATRNRPDPTYHPDPTR